MQQLTGWRISKNVIFALHCSQQNSMLTHIVKDGLYCFLSIQVIIYVNSFRKVSTSCVWKYHIGTLLSVLAESIITFLGFLVLISV